MAVAGWEDIKIAIVDWYHNFGYQMSNSFHHLGVHAESYLPADLILSDIDFLFSFGYFPDIWPLFEILTQYSKSQKILYAHWNTEGVPDLRVPPIIGKGLCILRSKIGKLDHKGFLPGSLQILNRKLNRFRYVGDFLYATRKGLMDFLFDSSVCYVDYEKKIGLSSHYIPWGTFSDDYQTMDIERDIDVLWMGKPRNKHRNNLVAHLKNELEKFGKKMVIIDGIIHPYVYGIERIRLFNRSKITLNLLPAWDAYNYIVKFHLSAGNRSIMVSEPFIAHNPEYIAGYHYVQTDIDNMVETLIYYSEHQAEREVIAENAYQLATKEMTMENSLKKIMEKVHLA